MSKIILYHNKCRGGKTFDIEDAQENYEDMIDEGWVDTPADLEELEQPEEDIEDAIDPSMTSEELIAAVKSLGFHVLTEVELAGMIAKEAAEMNAPEPLINRFFKSPTDLTKEELIVLGADYDLKLKMTMNEDTMIGHVTQAIEDSKTKGD